MSAAWWALIAFAWLALAAFTFRLLVRYNVERWKTNTVGDLVFDAYMCIICWPAGLIWLAMYKYDERRGDVPPRDATSLARRIAGLRDDRERRR